MKMKLYVSLPISGRKLDEAKKSAELVKSRWQSDNIEVVTPFDVTGESEDYNYCMGKCIETLLGCTGIILCNGWQHSKGCNSEYAVAMIYGKKIYNEADKV